MKDKRLMIAIVAVAVVMVLGCCVLVALGGLFLPSKPEHYGVYLKQGRTFTELEQYRGAPSRSDVEGIPATSDLNPTLILWEPTINLSYLELYETTSDWYVEYTTAASGEMLEVAPREELYSGRYCFVQGDPLGSPYTLSHWCFDVE